MIDLEMMARLLKAVPPATRLVLLGDKDQLASVEAGAVMAQLCQAPWLAQHTIALQHSHRFDAHQGIGLWARAANAGDTLKLEQLWHAAPNACFPADEAVSRLDSGNSHQASILQHLKQAWSTWLGLLTQFETQACDDAQALVLLQAFNQVGVLCALREGPWGVKSFNALIQQSLGFPDRDWFVGRPVMARRNDYALGLMNGDMGLCLPRTVNGETRLRVAFPDGAGGVRWQVPSRLEGVDTVFAMTVHQSQGSEFHQVLLVLPDQPAPLLTRELIYTGITRARQQLCIWAPQPALLAQACARQVHRSGGLAGG
jgi:exodeoxyribonuclease V alpha subunit